MIYLQQDGASREAELDAVLGGVVPREELQVLYGAVGQRRLHVAGGLETGQRQRDRETETEGQTVSETCRSFCV